MHDFKESLAMSHAAEDLPIWLEIYQKAFPDMTAMLNHRQDGQHQRQGIDRSIIMNNSKQFLVDEKVRGRNKKTGKVYTDILLEYWSDYERKVLGWANKPLLADYIAYTIMPLGKCYLLPVPQMQQTWAFNRDHWIAKYGTIKAYNKDKWSGRTWATWSCCIPSNVLFQAIGQCLRIEFTPIEIETTE